MKHANKQQTQGFGSLRPYQVNLVKQCQRHLDVEGKVVLAAGCGAGKTRMAIALLKKFLKKNPTQKVLFLAHGSKKLRVQVANNLAAETTFRTTEIGAKGEDLTAHVHVAIPHASVLKSQTYGMIIVDEAHHFYFGSMIQKLLENNPKAKQLLLTASHWRYTLLETYPIVVYSLLELLDQGVVMSPEVKMYTTVQEFRKFTADGDLDQSEELQHVSKIVKWIKKVSVGKTMIACHSVKEARKVAIALGKSAVITSSEDDPNDLDFKRFETEPSLKYLIVVMKGIIGFDMPELQTIVDITATKNVDRIFQLMGRIIRFHKGKEPVYWKMAPAIQKDYYLHIMSAVLHLGHPEFYRRFNGRVDSIRLMVQPIQAVQSKSTVKRKRGVPKFKPIIPRWEQLTSMFETVKSGSGTLYITTLAKVRDITLNNRDPEGKKKAILQFIEKYKRAPSKYAKNKEEVALQQALTAYASPTQKSHDPAFRQTLIDIGVLTPVLSPDVQKSQILSWCKEHGRAPSYTNEKVLYVSMLRYTKLDKKFAEAVKPFRVGTGGYASKAIKNSNNQVFESLAEAARVLNISKSTIASALKRGSKSAGLFWSYVDE